VVLLGIGFWWSNSPPRRPHNVPRSAVFLWSGHVGLPATKHGTWLSCWLDRRQNVDMCRVNEMDGNLEYEGIYTLAAGVKTIQDRDLSIDIDPTSDAMNWVRIDISHGAPLVFLRGGDILVPEEYRREALKRIDEIKTSRQ
jgi:hypothetical protein